MALLYDPKSMQARNGQEHVASAPMREFAIPITAVNAADDLESGNVTEDTAMWLQAAGSQYSSVNTAEFSDFSDLDGQEDDSIDPRVQEELERLNNATDDINKLEVELDDARAAFRQLLSDSSQRINAVAKKIGSSVEKARPYYDARMKAKQAHTETQKAALRFERANSAHAAAKEMVFLAEEGLQKEGRTFDPAWQEMLNHATIRVNEAERERTLSEQEHRRTSTAYNQIDAVVKDYMKDLKKNISKSSLSARRNLLQLNDLAQQHQLLLLPYFEMKAEFNKRMEEQKRRVQELEESVLKSKMSYADALHNLEEISDEIHQRRKRQEERRALGQRGHGVGAEHPEPSSKCQAHPGEVAHPRNDEEYMELPNNLRLNKSLSSSTISQMALASQCAEDRQARHASRLKKSKSVADRSEASPLFGRYSISRRNRLQVDHASQTDGAVNGNFLCVGDEAPALLDVSANSSSLSSIQSSGSSSPTFGSVNRRGVCVLPNLMSTSFVGENGDVSDTESLASIDVLSDEQIANLMMDKELEDAAESLRFRVRLDDEDDRRGRNMTTQTNTVAAESDRVVTARIDVVPAESDVTVITQTDVVAVEGDGTVDSHTKAAAVEDDRTLAEGGVAVAATKERVHSESVEILEDSDVATSPNPEESQ